MRLVSKTRSRYRFVLYAFHVGPHAFGSYHVQRLTEFEIERHVRSKEYAKIIKFQIQNRYE